MVTEQITNYESRIPNSESCKGSSKKLFCKHELTWSWDFLQYVHFFLHFVFSFMGDFFMNDPIHRCFLTFPCISPEKKHKFGIQNSDKYRIPTLKVGKQILACNIRSNSELQLIFDLMNLVITKFCD